MNVRDTVTGFTGLAVVKAIYLNGCVQFCVKPPINDGGEMQAGEYIDVQQLIQVVGPPKEFADVGAMADSPQEAYGA